MSYYLGKINKNEYLILKDKNKIKLNFNTTCFQGTKQFYQNKYLNVLNPDNTIVLSVYLLFIFLISFTLILIYGFIEL